jgi:hypothetical protein
MMKKTSNDTERYMKKWDVPSCKKYNSRCQQILPFRRHHLFFALSPKQKEKCRIALFQSQQ